MSGAAMTLRANLGLARRFRVPRPLVHAVLAVFVVGWSVHITRYCIATTNSYGGGNIPGRANDWEFYLKVGELAEGAARIQAAAKGPVTYVWGEGAAANVRSIRAGGINYPLPTDHVDFPRTPRRGNAGLVENGTGAVVLAVTGGTAGSCALLIRFMSPYTRGRASYAWVPGDISGSRTSGLPYGDFIDMATWTKVDATRWGEADKAPTSCGEDGNIKGTALYRFDGKPD